jgi:hypothetical protein
MRKKIFFLLLGIILAINGLAQKVPSVINSSGGTATYNELTFDWSVGEMAAVETFSTNRLIITQGFLQPVNLFIDQIDQLGIGSEKIVVYTDPENQSCNLETTFGKSGKLNYQLIDLNGRILLKEEANINELYSKHSINLLKFPNGFYLLKVYFTNNDGIISKTLKIQK